MTWRIEIGDCRDVLATLPERSVHTVVTSPPYFGLRDYGHDGQIGLEPTPDEFVAALVEVFRDVRRVLRDDGTVWLNLGDSYAANRSYQVSDSKHLAHDYGESNATVVHEGCKPKDLIGIPWMVAFALRADGWYLRSEIIWAKKNCMPESVTDRPTKSHEQIFLLSKGPRYFYDADAIREDATMTPQRRTTPTGFGRNDASRISPHLGEIAERSEVAPDYAGRNKRTVWTVATQPYAGAHFATFPPKLIEPCILAGAPERACGECGAPWTRRLSDRPYPAHLANATKAHGGTGNNLGGQRHQDWLDANPKKTLGFEPSCTHDAESIPGVVLDPFAGAGTTLLVADRLGRDAIGIELNPEYAALARGRVIDDAPLFAPEAELANHEQLAFDGEAA